MNFKFFLSDSFPFETGTMDLRSNSFEEGGNDAPRIELVELNQSDTYISELDELNRQVSWTNKILDELSRTDTHLDKLSKLVRSSELVRPPEKLKISNLLFDKPTTNSIMLKVIIHVLNVQESLGLNGFQKKSKTDLFGPNRESDQILAKRRWISTRPYEDMSWPISGAYSSPFKVLVVVISRGSPSFSQRLYLVKSLFLFSMSCF
ncbi:hypothetical protein Bca101_043543 [Brassica carinata]